MTTPLESKKQELREFIESRAAKQIIQPDILAANIAEDLLWWKPSKTNN